MSSEGAEQAFVEKALPWNASDNQQSAFSTFLSCIKEWAEMYKEGCYDLRNEETCRMSAEIVKLFGGDTYVHLSKYIRGKP